MAMKLERFIIRAHTELSIIYIKSFHDTDREEKTEQIKSLLNTMFSNIMDRIPTNMKFPRFVLNAGQK
jgi:hypothetical protein